MSFGLDEDSDALDNLSVVKERMAEPVEDSPSATTVDLNRHESVPLINSTRL